MHKVIRFVRICMTSQSESLTTVLFVKLAESLFFTGKVKRTIDCIIIL